MIHLVENINEKPYNGWNLLIKIPRSFRIKLI
jgi:hypothetical protein